MDCHIQFVAVLLLFSFLPGCNADPDSQGLEFIFPLPRGYTCKDPKILLTTSSSETVTANVTIPDLNFNRQYTLNNQNLVEISGAACISGGSGVKRNTITIHSTRPISVHAFNDFAHGDGFLALPTSTLGKIYYVASYKRAYSYFLFTAHHKPTSVEITPVNGKDPYTINLKPYQTYQAEGEINDPTGTRIQANETISFVTGHSCAFIGRGDCDSLLEQIPPIQVLGQNFILSPFKGRLKLGYLCRVIGVNETPTNVTFSNGENIQLDAGDMHEVDIVGDDALLEISADKPLMVVQYMKSGEGTFGDPSLVFIPGLDYFSGNITFPVANTGMDDKYPWTYYIHVIIDCASISRLYYDGALIKDWEVLTSRSGNMCSVRKGDVNPGLHRIENAILDAKFFVVAYAKRFGGDGQSYAYSAGFNMKKEIKITDPTTDGDTGSCTTCKDLNLICHGTAMTAIFNASALQYNDAEDVHLLNSSCKARDNGNGEAVITADYNTCGTVVESTDTLIIFKNTLISGEIDPKSKIIPLQVNIECRMKRHHRVDLNSFRSGMNTRVAYGNFTFNLEIFSDDTYSTPRDDYPIQINEGDEVYMAGSVETVVDLDLLLVSCWATPTDNALDDISYSLIDNGCAIDPFLTLDTSTDSNVAPFSFKAFAFKGGKWLVYIHCEMAVCDSKMNDSRCKQGCVKKTRRKRRSTSKLHTVTSGPIEVRG